MNVEIFATCFAATKDSTNCYSLSNLACTVRPNPNKATFEFTVFTQLRFSPDEAGLYSFLIRAYDEDNTGFTPLDTITVQVRSSVEEPMIQSATAFSLPCLPPRTISIRLLDAEEQTIAECPLIIRK